MDAEGFRLHVAIADYESRVGGIDFHLLGVRDLSFDVVGAGVELAPDLVGAQFGLDGARVFEERRFIADG